MAPPRIGLIVTGTETAQDFQHFLKTLEQWHPDAELFVYTDDTTDNIIKQMRFKGVIHTRQALNAYKGLSRIQMEKIKGITYTNLWTDFMYEKAAVIEWMCEIQATEKPEPAWFLDADISHLAPLPSIPSTATVALSPHAIRPQDEAKYGKYNGGFLWFKDATLLPVWRKAGHTARFFEQSALEDIAKVAGETLYEFPPQVNFGWWRMFQAPCSRQEIQTKFTIFRNDQSIGIRYDGKPLQSIHTHWFSTTAFECVSFRMWFDQFTSKFKTHKPLQNYRKLIGLN
jgi:hypothetical protein